tara:strand:+ start:108 stop:908 length:801 start_codon:yes stop_codon:yes gene_type:complete
MKGMNFFYETFLKDLRIAISYKAQFLLSFISIIFSFYFLIIFGSFVDAGQNKLLEGYNLSYFEFLFFGILVAEVTNVVINTMPNTIKIYQQTGIFEELVLAGKSEILIITSSLGYPCFRLLIRLLAYFCLMSFFQNKLIFLDSLTIIALLLFCISLIGISLIGCAFTIFLKGSSIIPQTYMMLSSILCGIAFPIESLPRILAYLGELFPTKHFLVILRNDFSDANVSSAHEIIILLAMSFILLTLGFRMINVSIKLSKKDGSLLFH